MLLLNLLCNSLLVGSSAYAMWKLPPLMPFGFAVAALSLVHGLFGLVRVVNDDVDEHNQLRLITSSIMEIIPLPMSNIELYLKSSHPQLALGHSCFFIPLAYDLLGKLHAIEDNATESLKQLTLMANALSMLHEALNQSTTVYGVMAGVAVTGRYLPSMLDCYILAGLGQPVSLVAHSVYVVIMALTLSASSQYQRQ